jgi:hypothetical protein
MFGESAVWFCRANPIQGVIMIKRLILNLPLHRVFITLIVLVFVLTACQMPASQPAPTEDTSPLLTQGALTVEADLTTQADMALPALQTQAALAPSPTSPKPVVPTTTPTQQGLPGPTQPPMEATATQAPAEVTATQVPPTATVTATSAIPTATPTLVVALLTAEIDTNCRQGPGASFEIISGLRAGKTAEVYGRDASDEWYFIQRPGGKADEYCWVWSDTTTVAGDDDVLPVIPPYPVQLNPVSLQWYFTIGAVNIHTCNVPTVFVMLQNTGFTQFESAQVNTWDATTGTALGSYFSNAPFTSFDKDCTGGFNVFPQNEMAFVRGPLANNLSGHLISASVTLCKEENLSGKCYFEAITFTMP